MESDNLVVDETERASVSVFLIDIFRPQKRSTILPTDRILLVSNERRGRDDREGRGPRPEGWGMPGGHGEPGEWYIRTGYRELGEETGVNPQYKKKIYNQVEIVDDRRMFLAEPGVDTESGPEKDEKGNLVYKTHWHLTVGGRLLVPWDETVIAIGKEDIKTAAWHRFDGLPSGVYGTHGKRIEIFYNRLTDKELFDYVFNQKS
ncbi:NUDIX hydrolase [Patescibacteria group bacterium AH-259-L05]|nr:NUDIX hydrolase [Patescibacteria group bacterium AH-259-L05]